MLLQTCLSHKQLLFSKKTVDKGGHEKGNKKILTKSKYKLKSSNKEQDYRIMGNVQR